MADFGQESVLIENATAWIPNSSRPSFFLSLSLNIDCLRRGVRPNPECSGSRKVTRLRFEWRSPRTPFQDSCLRPNELPRYRIRPASTAIASGHVLTAGSKGVWPQMTADLKAKDLGCRKVIRLRNTKSRESLRSSSSVAMARYAAITREIRRSNHCVWRLKPLCANRRIESRCSTESTLPDSRCPISTNRKGVPHSTRLGPVTNRCLPSRTVRNRMSLAL